jgi:hypothetical protein
LFVIAAGRRGCTSFALDFFVSFFIKKKRKERECYFEKNSASKPFGLKLLRAMVRGARNTQPYNAVGQETRLRRFKAATFIK